ncbi:putative NBD/HSP70 family sugar kinase [Biostraticola tofi]|uniref:Putative NBD/HSP70 family sugar kinase n=2 Tax=Biostraticola tofi TaxID=466109 RepID=A0A4R3YHP1_9GAMM|nr:ROK family protein [Biostraticola tofi]TCV91690.1 putative NBD/HSP70 family sugar kinase [Biostraticola tofi]
MKLVGLNNFQVRKHNKSLFMNLMWRHKQLSKSRLAQLTGLTIPATSKILQELMDDGKIDHSATALSHRGHNSGSFQLPVTGPWTLCICVTPTRIEYQLADAQLVARGECEQWIISVATPQALLAQIEALWRHICQQWPKQRINLALAVHGQVDPVTGVSQHMPQAAWKAPVELKYLLEERLATEVRIDNDCVMLALAEKWINSHLQREFCVINMDYGIGSSFVINGEIFRGNLYGSGQIGHTIVDPHGARCSCGRQGCLETVASLSALKQAAQLKNPELPPATNRQLFAAWQTGEPWIQDWVDHAAQAIGMSLYNFLNTLNINQIWLYGRSCAFGESWRQTIIQQIDFNPFDPRDGLKSRATNVHFGQLDRASQLLGIGYLYVENDQQAG